MNTRTRKEKVVPIGTAFFFSYLHGRIGSVRRRKYRAPQQGPHQFNADPIADTNLKSSPASGTNNANRFKYRRKKSSTQNGYWIFIPFFQVKLGRYPKPKTAFGEDLN